MELRQITKKRGQLGGLSGNIVALGVAAIALVLMVVILAEMRDTDVILTGDDGNSSGCNATNTQGCDEAWQNANLTLTGMATFGDFWTIIVLAIVAAVVIGIIFGAFGGLVRTNR